MTTPIIKALEFELAGYERTGNKERADLVKKEIAKLTPKKAKTETKESK